MISYYFYVRKSKINRDTGKCSIYLRLQNDTERKDTSIRRRVNPDHFDANTQRIDRRSSSAHINKTLAHIENRIESILKGRTVPISLDELKGQVFNEPSSVTLFELFQKHNDQIANDESVAKGTVTKYNTILKHLKEYLGKDIECYKINTELLEGFHSYLRENISHNTTVKYLHGLRKIVRIALKKGYMTEYPFTDYNHTTREKSPRYLDVEELKSIEEKRFEIDRLENVRLMFLLACYTGLSYSDLMKLSDDDVVKDGDDWYIIQPRTKTRNIAVVMLLPPAIPIIKTFLGGGLAPISNQKFNAYLKEIADLCGVQKRLTVHVARHTFATTVTLNHGVPIETVQYMMGHRDLRSTQHYAKVTTSKVKREMSKIKL